MTGSAIRRLSVCIRCAPKGWVGDDADRPGAVLARTLAFQMQRRGLDLSQLQHVRCLGNCRLAGVVAFTSVGRFTFLFDDLQPDDDSAALIDAFATYSARPDGDVLRAEWPECLRARQVCRIPPPERAINTIERIDQRQSSPKQEILLTRRTTGESS